MSTPRAVAVVGFKAAGKTQVVEALVRELTLRGLRVGTLKHASRTHLLDTPGKDTHRHQEAGSVASAILTSEATALFLNDQISVADAVEKLGYLDIVVFEGFKSLDTVARIVVPRDDEDVEALLNGLEIAISTPSEEGPSIEETTAPVIPLSHINELADRVESKAFPLLSGLNCGGCGYESCRELAQAILAGEAEADKCVNYWSESIRIKVNDRTVALKPFVNEIIRNVVLGMIRTLRGGEDPHKIELVFNVGGEDHG